MTQFVSHIPVDVAVTTGNRPVRPHHIEIKDHHHRQSDSNASFLRAARAGNVEKIQEYLKGSIDINTSNANGLNALHLAAKEGHVAVVTELIKKGANVNAATKKGNTALHIASLAGQEEVVKILIRNGGNANVQSQNGFSPLYMAAQENHDVVVKFLLANGANQSLATEDGFTPLAVALQQGHDKVVAVLLENDAKGRVRLPALHIAAKKDDCKAAALLLQNDHDPDVTSKSGFTPLHIAAHYGNENIGSLLLEKNADVNYSAKHQITPLHVAAKWGKSNMVTLLIDKGAKIDASTRDGLTPLHCAARGGHDQVVDLMLEKGAPITAKTKNGLAPLHMASQGDHVDSARILLCHKAPVDDVTVDYLTALHVAAHCGHVRVAKLLLDRKADPNARALNGFTPLHIACKKNRIKVVELLLKHGASIEATTESGLTPLHVASFMGCMNIVIYLIQHGANPDVPTVRGETPLHLAARANQSDIIRILLRNGAHVDASAREQQTPLHIAARLGNVDIVGLLLQHGAAVDATTKDMYTALHIAAKEGQEEVASVLLDHGASLTATTKKGFTPLHLAAKYGNIKVARLLLQKDAPVDAQGKNGVTPLHVAAHYDHVNVALLLLDKGAFPHATAKNGYTPLHIAAKKNQMDIATTLLEYGAKPSAESKAGFTPLHLAAQEGHTDMTTLLIEHHGDVNASAKNGLSPLHLCAQEDKVNVAAILVKNGARIDPPTKAGYTPLHVACHFGQINMIRFLLQHGADVNSTTSHGYTPLHQAAQQGHTLIINLLLENQASPNTTTNQGQTALSIAQRLGYISVVETLKIVTETVVTTTTTTITEEKYKVVAPETMQETFMSDSEDEGGDDIEDTSLYGKPAHATHVYLPYIEGQKLLMTEDTMLGDQSFHYLTADEMKSLGDDSLPIDVTRDERGADSTLIAPLTAEEDHLTPQHIMHQEATFNSSMATDNVDIARAPVHAGKLKWKTFLVSFMVDARGGAMRGCRHSGVRVIIPPRKAPMPMRITCRYLRKEKLAYPPPLMEGEACASRILEVGPSGAKFLGPVIIEVPHFAALRGREREITILRSDNGESWREHTVEASDEAVHDVFNESFEGEELTALEDLSTNRITRILTTDFPQYFAIITRIRQEVHAIGPEGGMVSSTVVPQVQAIFPEGALTKKIKVGLQAQPITPELVTKLLGNRVAVSPIVTVEPRRRKFHKPITLTIPVPQAATKGMINQYSGDAPTLRLLCSITGGTIKAQWEDVTGSTPLTFVNDCVSFTTTVSARFWLMDCRQVNEATKFATELYREAYHVPFMAKFVVFAKRHDPMEAQLRVFCMTDDKEDKTLESQEHFTEVAKSRDVEVLEAKPQFLEFAGNLVPVTKSGEQLSLTFQAFRENRLPFTIRVKDPHQEPMGRVAFMREPRVGRGEPPQSPICNLNIALPEADLTPVSELVTLEKKYGFVQETSLAKPELIHRADLRLSDIAKELGDDWVSLALQLDLPESDINSIRSECPNDTMQQALVMLRHWLQRAGSKATGNSLEKGLRKINREDIVNQCMFNVELVTDDVEKAVAKVHLDQSGFDTFKEELGSSRDASLRRETSLNGVFDEQDIMKDAESAAETSSESSDKDAAHFRSEVKQPVTFSESVRTDYRDGVVEQVITRTSTKVIEGPETLVQTVPTALAESFTQPASNGQMSDASVHEEDKSEPTVATLSSEATAEMEVSSLEDKAQAETHVEKQELSRTAITKTRVQKLIRNSIKEKQAGQTEKLHRKSKCKSIGAELSKKVSFDVYSRTMTPPATQRRRKIIVRRNSWPPNSPQKLNKRRKYQQRLKVIDLKEPFWIDSYHWLTMKNAPEVYKTAPLARLTEFEEVDGKVIFVKSPSVSSLSYSSRQVRSVQRKSGINKNILLDKNAIDIVPFYFIKKSKKQCPLVKDVQNYLKNLRKKCLLENIRSCEIRNVRPTNFNNISSEIEQPSSLNNNEDSWNKGLGYVFPISSIAKPSLEEVTVDFYPSCEPNDLPLEKENYFQEFLYRPPSAFVEHSPRASPKESILKDCNVIAYSPPALSNNAFYSMKQKVLSKENWHDKENSVKISNSPSVRINHSNHSPTSAAQNNLKGKPLTNKVYKGNVINNETFPKGIPLRSNPKEIPGGSPQDMPNPNIPNTSKNAPVTSQSKGSSTSTSCTAPKDSSTSQVVAQREASTCSSGTPSDTHGASEQFKKPDFGKDTELNSQKKKTFKETYDKKESKSSEKVGVSPKKEIEDSEKEDKSSESNNEIDLGQHFLEKLYTELQSSKTSHETLPATVVGQSFLKSLMQQHEQFEDTVRDKPFPASVIGQAFLNALVEQQNRSQEVPSCSSAPIPSPVISQTFLKSLVQDFPSAQECVKDKPIPASAVSQEFLKTLVTQSEEEKSDVKPIPSSVLGQTFLKSLVQGLPSAQECVKDKPVPASVVGQAFLKTLASQSEEEKTSDVKPIPSEVLGQSFLKALIQQSNIPESNEEKVISAPVTHSSHEATIMQAGENIQNIGTENIINVQQAEKQIEGTGSVPASVVGQSFLKSLIEQQRVVSKDERIPATVVGQAFLKTLYDSQTFQQDSDSNQTSIPSTVIGQTFLKSLMQLQSVKEESSEENTSTNLTTDKILSKNSAVAESEMSKPVPASVVGQSFLKTLVQQQSEAEDSGKIQPIPASVVEQSFLKTLIQQQSGVTETENVQPIPSCVVGQAFLKTLIDHQGETSKEKSERAIPATVVGQSFLKSLVDQQKDIEEKENNQPIPASVLSQSFLKSLIDQQKDIEEKKKNQPIPATVVGQSFLKSLVDQQKDIEEKQKDQPIPATVLGQAFLKTLAERQNVSETKKNCTATQEFSQTSDQTEYCKKDDIASKLIPSTVIGQSFLKSLITEQSETQEDTQEKSIPASVVGHAFLKSLVCQQSDKQEIEKQPIPASVVGQAFLKTLVGNQVTSEEHEGKHQNIIPSTVLGQTFLKSLITEQPIEKPADPIPAPVIGQAFLKTLICQSDAQTEEQPIPASVIGQAFLKTLSDHQNVSANKDQEQHPKPIPSEVVSQTFLKSLIQEQPVEKSTHPIPAPAVGQAFLKTLISEQSNIQGVEEEPVPASVVGQAFLKTLVDHQNVAPKSEQQHDMPMPSAVVGQTFLRTLVQEQSIEKGADPIPAAVLNQAFLKTLVEHQSEDHESDTKLIPATVVGQAFLKTLHGHSSSEKTDDAKTIPAAVLGQSFLKTLIEQQPHEQAAEKLTPACVIGQAFLKTLVADQEKYTDTSASFVGEGLTQHKPKGEEDVQLNSFSFDSQITSNTIEQNSTNKLELSFDENAFQNSFHESNSILKQPTEKDIILKDKLLGADSDDDPKSNVTGNIDETINIEILGIQSLEFTDIIPPPLEFSSNVEDTIITQSKALSVFGKDVIANEESSTLADSNPDVETTGIISELLSFTKLIKSVIGHMAESETASSGNVENPSVEKENKSDAVP